jgi:tRNA(fMet)-specific endonuclease VapC
MTYLLDTDTCVFALRGQKSVRDRLCAADAELVAISVITLAELRYGADCSTDPQANHQAVDGFADGVAVLGLGEPIARLFGEFKAQLRRQGALLDDFDLLIAATAHHYDLIIVTHNLGHFSRLPMLQLEDWVRT